MAEAQAEPRRTALRLRASRRPCGKLRLVSDGQAGLVGGHLYLLVFDSPCLTRLV